MGRITIFSRDDCHFCLRAKKELQYRCLPFVEINIATFPDRRQDMMDLSGCLTVPQIFLNDHYVGGSDELVELLGKWDVQVLEQQEVDRVTDVIQAKEDCSEAGHIISESILEHRRIWRKYQEEVASKPDPVDPRLMLPIPLVGENDNPQHGGNALSGRIPTVADDEYGSEGAIVDGEEIYFGCIPLPDGTCAGIREVTSDLVEHMPRHKLAYLAKFYTDCFPGNEGVDALLKIYPFQRPDDGDDESKARAKAVEFGHLLQQYGILHHVCNEHTFQDTSAYYYRLQPFHQPNVLNSFQSLDRVLEHMPKELPVPKSFLILPPADEMETEDSSIKKGKSIPPPPLVLTQEGALTLLIKLQKVLTNIEVRVTGRDGIDYLAAKDYDDPDYQLLEEGSCQLQCMDAMALASTMTDAEKTVFGIHLYNVMVRHAYIKVGVPIKASQRGAFFTGVCYNVANQILSLDDVEHGIIRANTRHPYQLKPQFVGDDLRRSWAVSKLDPRIHFTLFCGANSCPPICTYSVDKLDSELQLAAEAFVQDDCNVLVDPENNTLHLSMVFKWYRSDFGAANNKDLVAVILQLMPKRGDKYQKLAKMFQKKSGSFSNLFRSGGGSDVKIKFLPYDWGSKAAPGKCLEFRSGALKNRETSIRAPFSKQRGTSPLPRGCIPVP